MTTDEGLYDYADASDGLAGVVLVGTVAAFDNAFSTITTNSIATISAPSPMRRRVFTMRV